MQRWPSYPFATYVSGSMTPSLVPRATHLPQSRSPAYLILFVHFVKYSMRSVTIVSCSLFFTSSSFVGIFHTNAMLASHYSFDRSKMSTKFDVVNYSEVFCTIHNLLKSQQFSAFINLSSSFFICYSSITDTCMSFSIEFHVVYVGAYFDYFFLRCLSPSWYPFQTYPD